MHPFCPRLSGRTPTRRLDRLNRCKPSLPDNCTPSPLVREGVSLEQRLKLTVNSMVEFKQL